MRATHTCTHTCHSAHAHYTCTSHMHTKCSLYTPTHVHTHTHTLPYHPHFRRDFPHCKPWMRCSACGSRQKWLLPTKDWESLGMLCRNSMKLNRLVQAMGKNDLLDNHWQSGILHIIVLSGLSSGMCCAGA